MRKACLSSIYELASHDDRVIFIGSDITKRNLEKFSEEFPNRFLMEGIYEGHIIGMAAGLAMNGKIPYVNTLATFITRRCYEQILLDLCLHKLPVRLIGSGGGVVYAPLGPTHLANDDFAILRAIPNMTIIAPCDADEMERIMPQTIDWSGPIYIRLAKGGDKIISSDNNVCIIGKAIMLRPGHEILYITTGITSQIALDAAALLSEQGIEPKILHLHTIKPLDSATILEHAQDVKAIITVEEHTLPCGLGSAVSEILMESDINKNIIFKRFGFPDTFTDELGSQDQILDKYHISPVKIATYTKKILSNLSK